QLEGAARNAPRTRVGDDARPDGNGRRETGRKRNRGRAAPQARAEGGVNPLARVHAQLHGDTPVGTVEGEVDASNVVAIGETLRGLVSNRSTELVVDLTPTTYLDSAGINL